MLKRIKNAIDKWFEPPYPPDPKEIPREVVIQKCLDYGRSEQFETSIRQAIGNKIIFEGDELHIHLDLTLKMPEAYSVDTNFEDS